MDDALRQRLDSIERRQRIVIALLVIPYVLGVLRFRISFGAGRIVFTVVGTSVILLVGIRYVGRGSSHG
ncbi:hypothetical protein ACFQFH_05270 [Halobaculum halobium]|uniref:Uncharacterized protein n=1 Tax=Halobaculum halobium TaxID=3032281 RepID=A0ABD5TD54_9EURY|nr:hypothetical protein [Halobaculum sp. SYNS20]